MARVSSRGRSAGAFARSLDHVLNVPVAAHTLRSAAGSRNTRALSVSVARTPWPVALAFDQWVETSIEERQNRPSFNWASITTFRPDDPIILIHTGRAVQALMQFREAYHVPCSHGARGPLANISFLEVAPWNRSNAERRQFKGLGQLMLRFACQRSRQLGHQGRIGLHALSSAEGFYVRLGFSTPVCLNEYDEMYFELDPEAAAAFLAEEP